MIRYGKNYTLSFNGKNCMEYDLLIRERPSIPAPKRRITAVKIAGRDGEMIVNDDIYESIDIPVKFNFMAESPDKWADSFRKAKAWLKGSGMLIFSDDPDWFYKCQYVTITSTERTSRRIGNFTAEFHCKPYMYAVNGTETITVDGYKVIINPYMTSHPTYTIEGAGSGRIAVNNLAVAFESPGSLTIDTEQMTACDISNPYAPSFEGVRTYGYFQNIYMQPGENQVVITSGFTLSITPNWRTL